MLPIAAKESAMQIIVKLKDVIIDQAEPMDLTAIPAKNAIALLRKVCKP